MNTNGALLASSPEERGREEWTTTHELLAQLIEEVSIMTTETRRRKEPREVWRPPHLRQASKPAGSTGGPPSRQGISHAVGVLRATTPRAA